MAVKKKLAAAAFGVLAMGGIGAGVANAATPSPAPSSSALPHRVTPPMRPGLLVPMFSRVTRAARTQRVPRTPRRPGTPRMPPERPVPQTAGRTCSRAVRVVTRPAPTRPGQRPKPVTDLSGSHQGAPLYRAHPGVSLFGAG